MNHSVKLNVPHITHSHLFISMLAFWHYWGREAANTVSKLKNFLLIVFYVKSNLVFQKNWFLMAILDTKYFVFLIVQCMNWLLAICKLQKFFWMSSLWEKNKNEGFFTILLGALSLVRLPINNGKPHRLFRIYLASLVSIV